MERTLLDICDFINGGPWSENEYENSGIRVVKVSNMEDGTIVARDDDNYLPASKYEKYKKHELRTNDIVVATVGSHPTQPGSVVGRVSRIPPDYSGSFLNQNAVCLRVKRSDEWSQRYLYYLSNTILFKHHIESRARGSANQVRMALGELKRFTADYPSIHTQRRIAAILSAYDEFIDNSKRRIALLEKLAEEVYREWFVRLRFPGHKNAKFIKGIPLTWKVKRFGEIADFTMGQSPPSEFFNESGEGLPFHQGVGTYGDRFPHSVTYCSGTKGRKARKGDILFSVRAPVGRLNVADCEMIIGRGLAAIRHKEGHNSYLLYLLKVVFASEDIIGNGSIFNSVGKDELARFPVLKPDDDLVMQFQSIAVSIDRQIGILSKSVENLSRMREVLLPRLISGKLSVENLNIQFPPGMAEELNADEPTAAVHG